MLKYASLLAGLAVLAACGGADTQSEETRPTITQQAEIRNYADLEEYAGTFIYLTGKFMVHPRHRGKHALIILDPGLKVYLPHVDQYWQGNEWYRFDGQKVTIGGYLHAYVESPIDGMPGPYLDEATVPVVAEEVPKAQPAPTQTR